MHCQLHFALQVCNGSRSRLTILDKRRRKAHYSPHHTIYSVLATLSKKQLSTRKLTLATSMSPRTRMRTGAHLLRFATALAQKKLIVPLVIKKLSHKLGGTNPVSLDSITIRPFTERAITLRGLKIGNPPGGNWTVCGTSELLTASAYMACSQEH